MEWRKWLTSGFSFSQEESREELNYILFNSILLFDIFLVIAITLLRIIEQEWFLVLIDLTFITCGVSVFFLIRRSKKYFTPLFYFMTTLSYIMATFYFIVINNPVAGISWYIVLLMIVFFIKGQQQGTIIALILLITILVSGSLVLSYSKTELFLGVLPFLTAHLFMFFSEQRNNSLLLALEAQKNRYAHQAQHDTLTGLPNRKHFFRQLNHFIQEAENSGEKLAVLFMDFNHFKAINDTYGHKMGDHVLQESANRFKKYIYKGEILARFGGDEFAAIFRKAENLHLLEQRIHTFLDQMRHPISENHCKLEVSICIGCSIYPDDAKTEHELIEHADRAMYHAKADTRRQYFFYHEISQVLKNPLCSPK
jgi:diguanylate cyclase (GGDEF)-like protein